MSFKLFSTLEVVKSTHNGEIKVIKDLQGIRIIVGGISQSGWLVREVWETGVRAVAKEITSPEKVLILGLGGGSAVEAVAKQWKNAKIIGVDIDVQMVEMGKKYLGLGKFEQLDIIITDAKSWVKRQKLEYDVVLVDMFKGVNIPEYFKSEKYLNEVKKIVKSKGVVLFNHLYSSSEKEEALNLQNKLQKIFKKVVNIYPEANIIFLNIKD